MRLTADIPIAATIVEIPEDMSVTGQIEAAFALPLPASSVMTVAGTSRTLEQLIASSIASDRSPASPCSLSSCAALIPGGVAALPRPSMLALRFIAIADQLSESRRSGKSGRRTRRSNLPIRSTSPQDFKTESKPLQSMTEPVIVIASMIACSPLCRMLLISCSVLPLAMAVHTDASMRKAHSPLISMPPS